MKTVIIGATGHIGTWLVPRLIREGHDVVAVSRGNRKPYRNFPEAKHAHHIMLDRDATEADGTFGTTIAQLEADVVVDLICFHPDSASHLVSALRGRIHHFIHCGTLWVHGNPSKRPYDETEERHPFGEYGIRKAAIEALLLAEAQKGFPATVLHPGHITGPGWNPVNPQGNLNPEIFDRLSEGLTVSMPDDGQATLQHVHADDVAQAFELAIAKPEAALGESFHVAAREPVSMRNFAIEAASWFDTDAVLEFLPWHEWRAAVSTDDATVTLDHMMHSPNASVKKAERLLGYSPGFTATGAVKDALELS